MAAVNSKLPRWVYASVAKHLHEAATAAQLPLVVEHLDDRSIAWRNAPYKAEVTIGGPHTREISKDLRRVEVDVFIILSSNKQTNANAYTHLDYAGALANALDRCIRVYNYEPGNSSPELVGTLTPRTEDGASIPIDNLKPGEGDQLIHSVIEARYLGYFSEG